MNAGQTISDYEPFGAPLDERTFTESSVNSSQPTLPKPDFLWTFDDASLAEAYGSGLDATATGGPVSTADRCAAPDSAYRFDGVNDRLTVADNAGLDFGNQNFTVSVWVRKISHKPWGNAVVSKWNTGGTTGTNEWALAMGDNGNGLGAPAFHFESGTITYKVSSSVNVSLNTWYHLAGMRDGDTLRIFLNGAQTGKLYIGNISVNNVGRKLSFCQIEGGTYTNADIDEPAIFRRALTPQEIANLYAANCQAHTVSSNAPYDGYRFGFNGKEKIDEVYGDGNFYDYGFRVNDPRIGRFLSVDPLTQKFPMLTPYQFASNNPIQMIDLDGLEGVVATGTGAPFMENSRPTGIVLTAEDASRINKTIVVETFKLNTPSILGEKLIHNYAYGNEKPYVLSENEMKETVPRAIGIQGSTKSENDRWNNLINGMENGESTAIKWSYEAGAQQNGTLGNFTINAQGIVTKNDKGDWSFSGVMRFYDYWDFDPKPSGERNPVAETKVRFAKDYLPGKPYDVNSEYVPVKQSSSQNTFDWFKDMPRRGKENDIGVIQEIHEK